MKLFTETDKDSIMVHGTFGCNQYEDVPETDKDSI
jgi:hypothetical protein